MAEWRWVNVPGGFTEELVADACDFGGPGRCCIVVQTNATSSFHVTFSHSSSPSRGTGNPVLRFVVGKRKNSMTSVGLGNPYINKEPIDCTRDPEALLTDSETRSRTYWFLYDRNVATAAMGVQAPTPDLCRLLCRFQDKKGFRAEACENLRYISVSSGKKPVSVRIVRVCEPPDITITKHLFDPETWTGLPWNGASYIFTLDDVHRKLVERAQGLLAASPIAPFYGFVDRQFLCLNVYRLLDPLRRAEMFPGMGSDDILWKSCHSELTHRLQGVVQSAPWTYWPLRYDRADCTAITVAPTGPGCSQVVNEWLRAVQNAAVLRNGAMRNEMLTVTFAFEVFPVQGENAVQARRDVLRQIQALLEEEWGVMEFKGPELVWWQTHAQYIPFSA